MKDRIKLYLMNAKGLAVLQAVLAYKDAICCVVSARDANVQKDYYDEIRALSLDNGIPFFDRKKEPLSTFASPAYKMAIGWRWLIKDTKNLIIIHDSLLPKYRGFAPLVAQLIEGETIIGASAIVASKQYDEGDVVSQESVEVRYPITIQEAITAVSQCYMRLARYVVSQISKGKELPRQPQVNEDATYCLWRDDNDYWVRWCMPAARICRFVDAVGFPFLGARTLLNNTECRIRKVHSVADVVIHDRASHLGKVIYLHGGCPIVVCGEGLVSIDCAETLEGEAIDFLKIKFRSRFSSPNRSL